MTLALAGAILGFLRYNFNPATIFLGDCGSLFMGFMLSALALQGAQKAPTIIAVAIPVVSFGLPILETTLSIVRRFISGRPVFTARPRTHPSQTSAAGTFAPPGSDHAICVSAFFALLSLFLLWPTGSSLGLVLAVLGTGIWLGVQHLGYLEFGELRRVAQRTIEQRQIVINNLAIRRATEELKVGIGLLDRSCGYLKAAFGTNDFDAFDLNVGFLPGRYQRLRRLVVHRRCEFRRVLSLEETWNSFRARDGECMESQTRSIHRPQPSFRLLDHLSPVHYSRIAAGCESADFGFPDRFGRCSRSLPCTRV